MDVLAQNPDHSGENESKRKHRQRALPREVHIVTNAVLEAEIKDVLQENS
jgi:hypothetical protein